MTILVNNNITTGPKKFDVKAYANSTVWELRAAIAKHCKVTPDRVRLHKGGEVRGGFHLPRCRLWRGCVACSCVGDCVFPCVLLRGSCDQAVDVCGRRRACDVNPFCADRLVSSTCVMCASLLLWTCVMCASLLLSPVALGSNTQLTDSMNSSTLASAKFRLQDTVMSSIRTCIQHRCRPLHPRGQSAAPISHPFFLCPSPSPITFGQPLRPPALSSRAHLPLS